jgi:hypothetical protein
MMMVVMMVVMVMVPYVEARRRPPITVMVIMMVVILRELDVALRRTLGERGIVCLQQLNCVWNGFQEIPVTSGRSRL